MQRIVVAAIFLLLLGVWAEPLFTTANDTVTPTTLPAGPAPAYKLVRGAEGFWRLAQAPDGVWWFLSPDNTPEFLNTVTTVVPYQAARDRTGTSYISRDWNGGLSNSGDLDAWAQRTTARVREAGFKGLGAWCHPILHKQELPITRDLNLWTWMPGPARRFYSPQWATVAEEAVKVQVEPLRDNRNLVGYFIDNELDWGDGGSGPAFYFSHLPPADPNRREVMRIIQTLWPTPADFAKDWKLSLSDWAELDQWAALPHEPAAAYGRLFTAWLSHLAEDYFRTTTTLIRKYDPNHLILGVRFKGYAPLEVVRASRGYTDAQSLNYYVSDARLDLDLFRMMNEQSGQPLIISEYSFHSLDGRSGNRNTVGFAAQVLDQQARADGYKLFTTRLARVPYVVGADWFQWHDEPPSGRDSDGEDVNFGIMDVDDRPYDHLVEAVRQTTPTLNRLHAAAHMDEHRDVWRESFAAKPVMNVPRLASVLRLNGELSDWPAAAKLAGVRHSQTVGLERSPLPVPNVYLGWRPEGLYLGLEVFDNDIAAAPASGWWWTRDSVELWLSTQPVTADQNAYDVHSHQFFFVPQDPASHGGLAGVVGQWHRPGDSLNDHLIPHPAVRQSTRILSDRYVVEMFIPASALKGFEGKSGAQMAFNLHVRNFQHAIDYFWSAPKEVMTQLRPNTWGTLELQ